MVSMQCACNELSSCTVSAAAAVCHDVDAKSFEAQNKLHNFKIWLVNASFCFTSKSFQVDKLVAEDGIRKTNYNK